MLKEAWSDDVAWQMKGDKTSNQKVSVVTGAEQEQYGKVNLLALTFNFTRNIYYWT